MIPPLRDTRPIAEDELRDDQSDLLTRIEERLAGIIEDSHRLRPRGNGPWASADPDRTHRVLMIDGPRGAGKTSMLLTLIDRARRHADRPDTVWGRARVMPPLDFAPHPVSIHPYAWIVQAFQPLVACAEGLDERWLQLYKAALLAWSDEVGRHELSRDVHEFVLDQRDAQTGWHYLQRTWREFIDGLLAALVGAGELPDNGILVLPIDDLDLTPELAPDLVSSLRLLRHDRLVFLLTGHRDSLIDVLRLHVIGARRQAAGDEVEDDENIALAPAADRARDAVNKVIPLSNVESTRLWSLSDALGLQSNGKSLLDRMGEVGREKLGRSVPEALESLESLHPDLPFASVFRPRDLIDLVDAHAASGEEILVRLLCSAQNVRGTRAFARGPGPATVAWLLKREVYEDTVLTYRAVQASVYPTFGFAQKIAVDWNAEGRRHDVLGLALAAWAIGLAHDAPRRVFVEGLSWVAPDASPLAFTVKGQSVIGWPMSKKPRGPREAREHARLWAERIDGRIADIDTIAWLWIRFQTELLGQRVVVDEDSPSRWLELLDTVREAWLGRPSPDRHVFGAWARNVAAFAAPDLGLTVDRREQILDRLARGTTWRARDMQDSLRALAAVNVRLALPEDMPTRQEAAMTSLSPDPWFEYDKPLRIWSAWYRWTMPRGGACGSAMDDDLREVISAPWFGGDDPLEKPPHWASEKITALIEHTDSRREWIEMFERFRELHHGRAGFSLIAAGWAHLVGSYARLRALTTEDVAALLGWLQESADGQSIVYAGPRIELSYQFREGEDVSVAGVRARGWTDWKWRSVEILNEDPLAAGLIAWVMIAQAYADCCYVPMEAVTLRSDTLLVSEDDEVIVTPDFRSWIWADWARRAFTIIRLEAASHIANGSQPTAVRDFVVAGHLWGFAGYDRAERPSYPVGEETLTALGRALHRDRDDIRVEAFISPENAAAFRSVAETDG